jgi:hypothetical protein
MERAVCFGSLFFTPGYVALNLNARDVFGGDVRA